MNSEGVRCHPGRNFSKDALGPAWYIVQLGGGEVQWKENCLDLERMAFLPFHVMATDTSEDTCAQRDVDLIVGDRRKS